MKYPEHEKLEAKKLESRILSAFFDWLDEKKWELCGEAVNCEGLWYHTPVFISKERILCEFLDIDPKVLETEKLAMLDAIRKER